MSIRQQHRQSILHLMFQSCIGSSSGPSQQQSLPKLLTVDFSRNQATDAGFIAIVNAIQHCPRFRDIVFQENTLGDTGFKALHEGLKKDEDYAVGTYNLQSHGKAIASGHNQGMVKIIRGLPRGEILGAHILSDQATELIADNWIFS